ncbi:MAG: Na(+)/H(+) antiporter subunit B [Halanaerobiales bacterium]
MIILEYLLIFLFIISAFLAVSFKEELISIICLSVFSISLTALYLVYKAPDVALAEAVIGAGLNTAIFMTAVSQVRSGKKNYIPREED